ncbi:MAG: hypothetical protein U0L18_01535 [Acutalibacteraceae bacterium]|nr:hypothetical protein [Acutalibacteraceae bacterium]
MDIQCLYDIIAVLCDKICSLDKESESKLYRSYWSNVGTKTKELYERFPFLNPNNNTFDTIFDDINEEQWDNLLEYVQESDEIDLSLLSCLDRIEDLERGMKKYFLSSEYDVYKFSSLNSNSDVCGGKLIPKYKPKWKKTKERSPSELAEKALSVLQNFIWIKNSEVDGWDINNFCSNEWEYTGNTPFKIVCSPLVNKEPFDADKDIDGQIKYFYIKYLDDMKNVVAKRVERTLDYAAEVAADIVLFPEMVAFPELHEHIKGYVNKNWELSYPKIIFLPSSEHNKDSEWKDVTYAIDSSGKEIFEYCKQHPYQWDCEKQIETEIIKVKYFEPIHADYKISIIHYKGVGRIGVCICSDLFCKELMDLLLKTYSIDLLLILSYSEGRDRFERSISYAKEMVCDVVWCNCCAAYIDPKKEVNNDRCPAISYFPFGHANLDDKGTVDYTLLYRCSNSECESCSKCMKTIEINSSYK